MDKTPLYALALLIAAYILVSATITASYVTVYRLKIVYIAEGDGTVGKEIFSKTFPIAPDIPGWQHTINYTLLIDGKKATTVIETDTQGNKYVYPGREIAFKGKINITLVENIEIAPPPSREQRTPPKTACRKHASEKMLYLGGFWGHPFGNVGLEDLKKLSESLDGADDMDYIYRVIGWVLSNTRYKLGVRGGIMYPTEFYVEKHGACGDIHSFITTMLRIRGIPSYTYYALIYREDASTKIETRKASFKAINALPHIFTVARVCGKEFPIDLTYPAAHDPSSAIYGAGVNTGDNVVILYRIVDANPNDYLLVYAPSNNSRVAVEIEVSKNSYFTSTRPPLLALVALVILASLAVISLLKSTATVRAYNV